MMTKGRSLGSENPHPSGSSSCVAVVSSAEEMLFFWLLGLDASSSALLFVVVLSPTMAAPFPSSEAIGKISTDPMFKSWCFQEGR